MIPYTDPACEAPEAAVSNASRPTTGPGQTDPSPPTRGSSGDSPRSVSTALTSIRPVPGSALATSSSPVRTSAPWPHAVDVVNSVQRGARLSKRVRFSVTTNGKLTVASNSCHTRSRRSEKQAAVRFSARIPRCRASSAIRPTSVVLPLPRGPKNSSPREQPSERACASRSTGCARESRAHRTWRARGKSPEDYCFGTLFVFSK